VDKNPSHLVAHAAKKSDEKKSDEAREPKDPIAEAAEAA